MSQLSSWFLLVCVLNIIGVQKCFGVMNLPLQDKIIVEAFAPPSDNYDIIPKMAQYYKHNNIKVLFITSYYGEGPSIPLPERKRLVKAWEEQANCLGFDIIVEVGAMPFVDTLELARYCSTLNVTAITTYAEIVYQATTLSEALEDLQRICDAAGNKLPLLYHDFNVINQNIKTDQIFKGAIDGCVSCFVGALTSVNAFLDCKAAVPSIDGYQLFGFGIDVIAAALSVGMNASVSIDLFPDLAWKIKDAVDNCKLDLATDLQQELNRRMYAVTNVYGGTVDPACRTYVEQSKAAFQLLSCIDTEYRYPSEKPNSTVFNRIQSSFQDFGIPLCNSSNNH